MSPSPSTPATPGATASGPDSRLRATLEANPLKFHVKAGNAKWACTLMDRASYERQKATRTDSSSSGTSTSSGSSIASK